MSPEGDVQSPVFFAEDPTLIVSIEPSLRVCLLVLVKDAQHLVIERLFVLHDPLAQGHPKLAVRNVLFGDGHQADKTVVNVTEELSIGDSLVPIQVDKGERFLIKYSLLLMAFSGFLYIFSMRALKESVLTVVDLVFWIKTV